jgi:hypothetical protein
MQGGIKGGVLVKAVKRASTGEVVGTDSSDMLICLQPVCVGGGDTGATFMASRADVYCVLEWGCGCVDVSRWWGSRCVRGRSNGSNANFSSSCVESGTT